MRKPTNEEVLHFQSLAQDERGDKTYYENMIPIILEHINKRIQIEPFNDDDYLLLPGDVRLFIAKTVTWFGNAEFGLKSESVSSVSFTYDFAQLPDALTDLLSDYGYSTAKKIKFIPVW